MPDRRQNRGPHPRDEDDFAADHIPRLRIACFELSWLFERGYTGTAALKLVGDRHRLRLRQRQALQRCAVSHGLAKTRNERCVPLDALADERVLIDGYNVLLTVEAALAGGVVLLARDGLARDLAAMSSHYRRVKQTRPALEAIATVLDRHGYREALWYFDRPVSNSGRLRNLIETLAEERGWPWRIELVPNPDPVLAVATELIATADGGILDRGPRWVNLARAVIESAAPDAWWIDLSTPDDPTLAEGHDQPAL
ncbi:MAG: DUF434 domain-containing protein [Acidobacteriota bacterium]